MQIYSLYPSMSRSCQSEGQAALSDSNMSDKELIVKKKKPTR